MARQYTKVEHLTGIPTPQGMRYMCAVVDLCGKVVLAWRLGNDMTASLVTDTIRDALQQEKVTDGLALHSDQGSQYTSQAYFDLSKEYHFVPSMSSPGCPYIEAVKTCRIRMISVITCLVNSCANLI